MSKQIPKRQFIYQISSIFTTERQTLLNIAFGILKVSEDAEDAVSNAFACLIQRSKKRYFRDINLKGLVAKCVENEAINVYNNRKRRNEIEGECQLQYSNSDTPYFLTRGQMTMDTIISKLDLVRPQTYASVWKLHHIEGMSHTDIQTELYLTDKQVRDWIYEANKQMKILLESCLQDVKAKYY